MAEQNAEGNLRLAEEQGLTEERAYTFPDPAPALAKRGSGTPRELSRVLRLGLLLPIAGLLLLSVVLGLLVYRVLEANSWLEHTDVVIGEVRLAQRLMIDAETGFRGFLLTGVDAFLEPYETGKEKIPHLLDELNELVRDNSAQRARLREIRARYEDWLALWHRILLERRSGQVKLALETVKNLEGKRRMDAIRVLVDQFVGTEERLKEARATRLANSERTLMGLGALVVLLTAASLAYFTRRGLLRTGDFYKSSLEHSEDQSQYLATVLRSIGDCVIVTDKEGRINFMNPPAQALTGYDLSEAKGEPLERIFRIIDQKTRRPAFNPVGRVLREGTILGLANHTVLIAKSGEEFAIEDSAAPIKNSRGEVLGAVLAFRDISERYRAEQSLAMSRERLDLATSAAQIGIWEWNISTSDVVWDENYRRQFDFPPGKLRGSQSETLAKLHAEDQGRVMEIVHLSHVERRPYEALYRVVRNDGQVAWIRATGVTQFDEDGKPARMVGTVSDVTKFKEIETELRAAVAARDEFMSVASHELKTPLTSLKLQAQITARKLDGPDRGYVAPERIKQFSRQISAQVDRLIELIENMLDVSRLQAGKLPIVTGKVNLGDLVKEVAEQLRPALEKAGCEVTLEIDSSPVGNWDRNRIEQVVTNLLTNAMKYAKGTPITVRIAEAAGNAELSVKDQGMGIAHEHHEKIFGRFQRAISANEISGLGLGLFIVREILNAHGGRITVQSEVGKGADFRVVIPLEPQDERARDGGVV
jgi:PAS domain S-box-containing protein